MFSADAIPFWTAVAAAAAMGSALIAAVYTYLTYRLVKAQDQAKVVVFVRHDFERTTLLCIRIQNIGREIARDIRFRASKPIPARAFGIEGADDSRLTEMKEGPLVEGIPALGPGDVREITWGQIGGLTEALGGDPIFVDYTYRSGKSRLKGTTVLEVRSFWDTDASERPVVSNARALKRIATSLDSLQRSVSQLHALLGRDRNEGAPKP